MQNILYKIPQTVINSKTLDVTSSDRKKKTIMKEEKSS